MDEYIRREDAIKAIGYSDTAQPSYTTEFFTSLKTRTEAMRKVEEIPAADVAPVVHGTPQKVNRPESEVIYKEVKTESGKVLYERHVFLDNKNWVEYCSKCGKRLCSRFTNYCPNCGAKMDGGTTP